MQRILIPSTPDPYVIKINGVTYTYEAGTYQDVPDDIAEFIRNNTVEYPYQEIVPKYLPAFTKEDDGKFLRVRDGKLSAEEFPVYDGTVV